MERGSENNFSVNDFIFSRPNIVSNPEKVSNFEVNSANIFGGKSNFSTDASSFTFSKPTDIDRTEKISSTRSKLKENSVQVSEARESPKISARKVKDSSVFCLLEKNTKSRNIKLDFSKSITCSDVPDELLNQSVAAEHFEKFGETYKIRIRPKQKMVTVYFANKEAAIAAYNNTVFKGHIYKVEWTNIDKLGKARKSETVKKRIESILNISDEVKEELEAMTGLEYNLPDPANIKSLASIAKAKIRRAKIVANKGAQKLSKTTSKPEKTVVKNSVLQVPANLKQETTTICKPVLPVPLPKITMSLKNIEELQNLIKQPASSAEEKYKILDARDKLLRLKRGKPTTLDTAKVTKGICPDMCPEKERLMREFQRQVSYYEQMAGGEYRIDHRCAVKQYSRSSADQEEPMPHELRPVRALKMTMSYLLHEIADLSEKEDTNLAEWYHFLWDRTRGIRKDITQQELCCPESVNLVEMCARFHIICSERLCAEDVAVFDPKINSENLTKCLQTLKYMYHDLRERGVVCVHESEFRAYIILLNLNNGSFISELRTLPSSILNSCEVKFAFEIYSAIEMNNYSKFFKLVRKTTFLNACILLRYFNQIRVRALSVMVKAYCRTTGVTEYPLYELIDILGFEDENDAIDFCSRAGLRCNRDNLYVKLSKENFLIPESTGEQVRAYNLVHSKRNQLKWTIGQCVAGGILPEKVYENHVPHDSFDSDGFLLKASINADDQDKIKSSAQKLESSNLFVDVQKANEISDSCFKRRDEKQLKSRSDQVDSSLKSGVVKFPNRNDPVIVNKNFGHSITNCEGDKNLLKKTHTALSSTNLNIFSKPATGFSAKSSADTDSPFKVGTSKSIFSASVKSNVFNISAPKVVSAPVSAVNDISNRLSTKRRFEDTDDVVCKPSTGKQELSKKCFVKTEEEEKLEKEQKRMKLLQIMDEKSHICYVDIENQVVEEMCSSVVKAELEKIELFETLGCSIYDSIFQEICEGILDEQLFVQDMLIEVSKRLRDKMIMKYYKTWKQWSLKKRAQRREALDNTPVWLQPESIEECAGKMYKPVQSLAVKYARKCRLKNTVSEKAGPRHAPIEYIVNVGLKENSKSFDIDTCTRLFWKMVISWPAQVNRLNLWRHKRIINRYLSPEDNTVDPILIAHKPNSAETLHICIRHFDGLICEQFLIGMDALLFIISPDEDLKAIERRLTKTVLSREKLMPIPLVIIIFGDNRLNLKVSSVVEILLDSGHISEYTVLHEQSIDENIILRIMQSASLWLAINRSPSIPLVMDKLKTVLDDCLTEELWLRVQSHLSYNDYFSKAIDNPNFIIDLHNEAVNHLMDIILDPESLTYTDFSPEFKIFLNRDRTFPCTYEYFDNTWKQVEYRADLELDISGFILPAWTFTWPICSTVELHSAVNSYCNKVIPEFASKLTNKIMSDFFLIMLNDGSPSFIDIIINITREKIKIIEENKKVVYNKNHIKHFQNLPWWFKSRILSRYIQNIDYQPVSSADVAVTESIDFETSFNEVVEKFNETVEKYDSPAENLSINTSMNLSDIQSASQKLEEGLKKQKLESDYLQKKLEKALLDT